jgi:vitamin B12 transporter
MKRKVTKGMLMTALICGTISILPHGVYAEEVAEEEALQGFTLDQVVVTATRTPVEAFKAQANINVITSEKIEKMHYKDLYWALRDVPGVQTHSYGQDGYLTSDAFSINGSNKVVILVDGIRANQGAEIYSPGVFGDLSNVERVEVLKGAASALYGADAQGGVINIITKKAGSGKSKVFFNSGSYGKQEYGMNFNTRQGKWGIRASARKLKNKDFKSADGLRVTNDSQTNTYNFGINYELKENSSIDFNYDLMNNRTFYKTPGLDDSNPGKYDAVNARLVWNHEFDKDTHNVLSIGHHRTAYVTTWATNIYRSLLIQEQFSKKLGNNLLTAGIDHESTKVVKAPADWYTGKDATGETFRTTAFYLQDQWDITKKLKLIAGVRYTDPNAFDSKWTPSINLGYEFNNNTNMYVAWSKFFDTPSMFQMFDSKHGTPGLKPETGKNFEVGINHRFSNDFTASAHYFYRNTTDFINYDYGTERFYNMDNEVRAKGFDIQMKKAFGRHLNTSVGYTYLNMPATGTTPTAASNNGGFLPRGTWNIGIDYTNKGFDAGLTGRGIIKRPGYYSPAGKAFPNDTYWVWDLNMSYKFKKNIKVYANVYNLFNQNYAENSDVYWAAMGWGSLGSGYKWWPMPGRTFLAGIEYTF